MTNDALRVGLLRSGGGALLVLAGAALALWAGSADRAEPARALGPERPVNAGAGDRTDIGANTTPAVVRNPRDPRNLVVTNRIDSPDFSCAVWSTTDGGRRWSRARVMLPAGEGRKCYAPDAVFGRDGTLYVSYVTLRGVANTPAALWVAASRDGGRTLEPPRRVSGPRAFQARVAADPEHPRRLYVTWVQARDVGNLKFTAPGNPIRLARSDDGGATWSAPVRVNDPARGRAVAPVPAVGGDGALYVLYLDLRGDRLDYEGAHENTGGPPYPGRFTLVLARSRTRGARWAESAVDERVVPIGRFIPFLPPFPALAIDRDRNRVYVAFHDARLGGADVMVWSLGPGDRRWRGPVRVNDTPRGDTTSQYLPQLAVAPDGRLDVAYYDRRRDPRDLRTALSLQSSHDGGESFDAHVTLTLRPFDPRIGFGGERGLPQLGSRIGLSSTSDEALAVWTDTRSGTEASAKQDLYAARAAPSSPGMEAGTADDLGRAGLALMLGGFAALALALRRRRG